MVRDRLNWVSRRPWAAFAILLAVYSIGILLPSLVSLPNFIKPTSEWIYFWTGVVIIWYAVETHAMRREVTRQADLSVRPAVLARIDDNPHMLILRNIGNGPALYVKVEDIEFETIEFGTGRRAGKPDHVATFASTGVIEARSEVPATIQLVRHTGQGRESVFDYLSALDPRYQKTLDLPVVISYQDLYGGLHRTRLGMGKSGTRLIGFESRVVR